MRARDLFGLFSAWRKRRTQPPPLPSGHPFEGATEAEIKAALAAALRGAHDEGRAAERKRVAEVLQAPGAALFPDLAIDLALGTATGAQAAAVLARAEADAATRAGAIKSSILDRASSQVTLH
jgi:hypothetical protein